MVVIDPASSRLALRMQTSFRICPLGKFKAFVGILCLTLYFRRKTNTRSSGLSDPVFIEPEILKALMLYLQSNVDDVVALVAKFLNIFIMDSPFLEGFEVDNFILRNGKLVSLWYGPYNCVKPILY